MKHILLLVLLCCGGVVAQDKPQPDRWRELIVDQSSPDDAIAKLGKPDEDKTERLRIFYVDGKLLTEDHKKKLYRELTWKKLDGLKQVKLSFKDGKLLVVYLWLEKEKEFAAATISSLYGLEFIAKTDSITEAFQGPIGGPPLSGRKNVSYPTVYALIARTEKTWLAATVGNSSFKHAMIGDGDTSKETGAFPGKIVAVQIVSRTLENRAGGDILK